MSSDLQNVFDPELFLSLPPLIRYKVYTHFTANSYDFTCNFSSPALTPPNPHGLFFSSDNEGRPHKRSKLRKISSSDYIQKYKDRFPVVSEHDFLTTLVEIEEHFGEARQFIGDFIDYSLWVPHDCIILDWFRLCNAFDFWYIRASRTETGVEKFEPDWKKWVVYKKNAENLTCVQYELLDYLKNIHGGMFQEGSLISVSDHFFTMIGLEEAAVNADDTYLEWLKCLGMVSINGPISWDSIERIRMLENLQLLKLRLLEVKIFERLLQKIIEFRLPLRELVLDFTQFEVQPNDVRAQQWYRLKYFNNLNIEVLRLCNNKSFELDLEKFIKIQLHINKNLKSIHFENFHSIRWFSNFDDSAIKLFEKIKLTLIFQDCGFSGVSEDKLFIPGYIASNRTEKDRCTMDLQKSKISIYRPVFRT